MKRGAIATLTALLLLPAPPAGARPDFQAVCERLVGAEAATLVVSEPASGRLLALVNPDMAETAFPPGSLAKLVTALAGLRAGVIGPRWQYECRGFYRSRHRAAAPLACWKTGGHGVLDLEQALARSCNAAHYALAETLGAEALQAEAQRVGWGEAPGWRRLPKAPNGVAKRGVGEGPSLAVTPLQVMGLVGAIASGTGPRRPGWGAGGPSGQPLPVTSLRRLRAAMRLAVVLGSARDAAVPGLAVAGKTGTATYLDGSNRTYGWFAGYAPAEKPRVAVVVLHKDASGFGRSAPFASRVFAAWRAAGSP